MSLLDYGLAPAAPKAERMTEFRFNAVAHAKSRQTIKQNAIARYSKVFAEPITSVAGSGLLGISHNACNIQLYRYEKKGFMKRVGSRPHNGRGLPAILWVWVGPKGGAV